MTETIRISSDADTSLQGSADDSSTRRAWAAGSLAVVIPVGGSSTLTAAESAEEPEVWDLKSLRRAGGRSGPLAAPNVRTWADIGDQRIKRTMKQMRYVHLHGDSPAIKPGQASGRPAPRGLPTLVPRRPGCLVNAIEVFTFTDEEQTHSYVVLHIVIEDPARHDVAASVAYFSLPYSRNDQKRARWPQAELEQFLSADPQATSSSGLGFPRKSEIGRPFVISHVVPDGVLPDASPELSRATDWSPEQVWAWRLAAGSNLTLDREPGFSPGAPTENGFWVGSTWCRASTSGLALVATRAIDELPTATVDEGQVYWSLGKRQYIEHASLEGFAHRPAVDLVILSMRQSRFLTRHADKLTDLQWADVRHADAQQRRAGFERVRLCALELELELLEFRNDLWFGAVPGDEPVTRTMTTLQQVHGSTSLLLEVDQEQKDISRVLTLAAEQAGREAEEIVQVARKEMMDRQEKFDRLLRYVAPVVTIPALVFTAAQVIQGGGGPAPYFWLGAAVSLVLCILSWIALGSFFRPRRRNSDSEPV